MPPALANYASWANYFIADPAERGAVQNADDDAFLNLADYAQNLHPGEDDARSSYLPVFDVVDKLAVKYGEAFSGGGLQSAESIFEVWHSAEKGTWTILMTRADGTSCIMASGTNWREGLKVPAGIPG